MKIKLMIALSTVLVVSLAIAARAYASYSTAPYTYCSQVSNADNCKNSNGCLAPGQAYQCAAFSDNPNAVFTAYYNYNLPYSRCGSLSQISGSCRNPMQDPICQTRGCVANSRNNCGTLTCTANITDYTCQFTNPPPPNM